MQITNLWSKIKELVGENPLPFTIKLSISFKLNGKKIKIERKYDDFHFFNLPSYFSEKDSVDIYQKLIDKLENEGE